MSSDPFYEEDLAAIHDAGYTAVGRAAAELLLAELASRGATAGRILELGCGSGVLMERCAREGFEVVGVDLSPAMLRLAAARVPEAQCLTASVWDVLIPPVVAVAAVGEVLCYTAAGRPTRDDLGALFRRVHAALLRDGLFLFDTAEPGRVPGGTGTHWAEGDGWHVAVHSTETAEPPLVTRRIVSYWRVGGAELFRRTEEVHEVWLWEPAVVLQGLRDAGLDATILGGYPGASIPSGVSAFLARAVARREHRACARPAC